MKSTTSNVRFHLLLLQNVIFFDKIRKIWHAKEILNNFVFRNLLISKSWFVDEKGIQNFFTRFGYQYQESYRVKE